MCAHGVLYNVACVCLTGQRRCTAQRDRHEHAGRAALRGSAAGPPDRRCIIASRHALAPPAAAGQRCGLAEHATPLRGGPQHTQRAPSCRWSDVFVCGLDCSHTHIHISALQARVAMVWLPQRWHARVTAHHPPAHRQVNTVCSVHLTHLLSHALTHSLASVQLRAAAHWGL